MNEKSEVIEQESTGQEFIHEEAKPNVEETEALLVSEEAEKLAAEVEALRLLEIALTEQKRRETRLMFHRPTATHNPAKGNGKTTVNARKAEAKSKKARKQSQKSRKINRGR